LFAHVEEAVRTFHRAGLRSGDRVAVVLPNGADMAVTFLAVSAAFTCAPLNPACRAGEFEFYLSCLKPQALIVEAGTDAPARAIAGRHSIPIIEWSRATEVAGLFTLECGNGAGDGRNRFAGAGDVALILHTSGTTSRPKMVPLTHSSLLASARNVATALRLTDTDRCLNVMPLFHVHGLVGAVLSSLAAGSSVVCVPEFTAPAFLDWLEEFHPTWYTAVPVMHRAIAERVNESRRERPASSLRFIRSSSAPLHRKLMAELEEIFNIPVIEAYGMTEAAHQIASNPLPPERRKPGSVGIATGTEIAIVSDSGDLLPNGETGEIAVRGASVSRGYESDSASDPSAFVRGYFRTGDLGYRDADGYLFITGRLKEVINRGGEKISLREIDEALLQCPEVRDAAAFAVPHPTLGEDLAAAVALVKNSSATEAEIREDLLRRVAEFKVPSRLLIVDEIPRNAAGKISRSEVAGELAGATMRRFVAPKSGLEAQVAEIYAEVLGIERVGAADNFFALGGDSLRAMQVMSRLREGFQIDLPVGTLFKKPTVADLAGEIAASAAVGDHLAILGVLKELRNLSDEEARRLIHAEPGATRSSK
jgi:acyl-CoA synthetase (AMP-forming)/AMP-acid ligase II/acyl carrier protein